MITIRFSKDIFNLLNKDAINFKITRKDPQKGYVPNISKMLNLIIIHTIQFYDYNSNNEIKLSNPYASRLKKDFMPFFNEKSIQKSFRQDWSEEKSFSIKELTDHIEKMSIKNNDKKGKKDEKTNPITKITNTNVEGDLSVYDILVEYFSFPSYIREQIIKKDIMDYIKRAIDNKEIIRVKTINSTRGKDIKSKQSDGFSFYPIRTTISPDENHTVIIGYFINKIDNVIKEQNDILKEKNSFNKDVFASNLSFINLSNIIEVPISAKRAVMTHNVPETFKNILYANEEDNKQLTTEELNKLDENLKNIYTKRKVPILSKTDNSFAKELAYIIENGHARSYYVPKIMTEYFSFKKLDETEINTNIVKNCMIANVFFNDYSDEDKLIVEVKGPKENLDTFFKFYEEYVKKE